MRIRLGLLIDFVEIYNRLPNTPDDWQSLDAISKGALPARALKAEAKAIIAFKQIFKRFVNYQVGSEDRFVQMVAYRLRVQPRDLSKEQTALKMFVEVYNSLPANGFAWSIIRALAYSGVK